MAPVDVGRQVAAREDVLHGPLPAEPFDHLWKEREERPGGAEQRHDAHEHVAAGLRDAQQLAERSVGAAEHVAQWAAVANRRVERRVAEPAEVDDVEELPCLDRVFDLRGSRGVELELRR